MYKNKPVTCLASWKRWSKISLPVAVKLSGGHGSLEHPCNKEQTSCFFFCVCMGVSCRNALFLHVHVQDVLWSQLGAFCLCMLLQKCIESMAKWPAPCSHTEDKLGGPVAQSVRNCTLLKARSCKILGGLIFTGHIIVKNVQTCQTPRSMVMTALLLPREKNEVPA